MTAHVVSDENPSYTLFCITELLQKEHGIFHSTVQVEPSKRSHRVADGSDLQKCINEHNFLKAGAPAH